MSRAGLRAALTVALASVAVLSGCAGAPPAPVPTTTSASPSSSPSPTPLTIDEQAQQRVAAMTTREKVSSVLMLHTPGTDGATLTGFMRDTGAGGFILMGDNIDGPAGSVAATSAAIGADQDIPPLIGIDQEGGYVERLDEDDAPAAPQLRTEAPEATREAFRERAELVREAGANINFGIVADVTADTSSFIYDRVLGTTPQDAAARVAEAVQGERGIVLSTIKHFPGHGRSDADSHVSVPSTDVGYDEWRATDALPFDAGIDAGAEAVMFGHLAYTSVDSQPASLSPRWHEILRQDLGFEGLVVTDDMLMLQNTGLDEFQDPVENAVRALAAGNDVLLYVLAADPEVSGVSPEQLVDGLTAAVESGRIPLERLDDAATRVAASRLALD